MPEKMKIVFIGLSITSSWGNGHATTYRGLIKALAKKGHQVIFLEQDVPWYASHRDLPEPGYCETFLYQDLNELKKEHAGRVRDADLVVVGSYVADGVEAGEWVVKTARGVKAFYDIDTPVTLARLDKRDYLYINPDLIRKYDLYLSFTGGPTLEFLETRLGSPMARPLYCSVDPFLYYPEPTPVKWTLGYLGTYSPDRQPVLRKLMLDAAETWPEGKFIVAGPQYPEGTRWPRNVERRQHIPPDEHRLFYNSQWFTLNVTRADMVKRGYSPSVRLFEAAACGTPVISDYWAGLETFFRPGRDILVAEDAGQTLACLRETDRKQRDRIAASARDAVLSRHTAAHRAEELEGYARRLLTDTADEADEDKRENLHRERSGGACPLVS